MNQFFNYQGNNIHYSVTGTGDAIVLIHGFTESLDIWDEYTQELSISNHVVRIDLPGHGKSDCIGKIHTMDAMANLIYEIVVNNLKIEKAHFVGHSMGGYVALALAEAYPEIFKSLCLFHSSASEDSEEIKANRSRTIEIVKQDRFNFVQQFIPSLFAEENKERCKPIIEKLITNASKMSKEAIIAAIEGMRNRKSRIEVLINLHVPVLFIVGKKDSRIKFESLLAQMALPKHAEALILENVGHMGYAEARKTILEALKCFFGRN